MRWARTFLILALSVTGGCASGQAPGLDGTGQEAPGMSVEAIEHGRRIRDFVDLPGQPVVHGIDVSRHNTNVPYRDLAQRGARFAYVRVSFGATREFNRGRLAIDDDREPETENMWRAAMDAGMLVGGYHYLTFPNRGQVPDLGHRVPRRAAAARNEILNSARAQARFFARKFRAILARNPTQFLPPVIDVESGPRQTDVRAPLYGQAVCAFITELRRQPGFARTPLMLYSRDDIWTRYELASAPCNLRALPVWVANYSTVDSTPPVSTLCPDTGRCRIHQYTDRAALADPNLDLNRFHGTVADLCRMLTSLDRPLPRPVLCPAPPPAPAPRPRQPAGRR